MSGKPVLSNCQVLCDSCHKAEPAVDLGDLAKAWRREDVYYGIRTAATPADPQRAHAKRPPHRRASSPSSKPSLPPRQLYVEH
ncbi:hypothetical protein [Methylorubrum populi]